MALSLVVNRPLLPAAAPQFQLSPKLHFSSTQIRSSSSSSAFTHKTLPSLKTTTTTTSTSSNPTTTTTTTTTNPFLCRFSTAQFGQQGQESNYAEAIAIGRHIRMSADKARRVIDQIRGRPYEETLMILELMPYRACEDILKIVFSAGANANNNLGLSKSTLVISKAEVNEGKTLKRIQPRAQGRANRILKRTCHISITVKGLPSESVSVVEPKSA